MQSRLFRALSGLVLLVLIAGPADAQALAGKVVAIAGACTVEARGSKTTLKMGSPVNIGDVVEVADDAKLKLRMNDGSVLSVGSGTKMTVSDYTLDAGGKREKVEVSLGQGLLRAVVSPVDHPSTFEVKTATGTAAVRSTDWFIQAQPNLTEVAVQTGVVTLESSSTGVKVSIPALYTSSVAEGHDPVDPYPMKAADFTPLIAAVEITAPPPRPAPTRRRSQPQQEYNQDPGNQNQEQSPPPSNGPPPGYEGPPPGAYDGPPPGYGGPGPGGYGGPGGGGFGFGFGGRGGGGGGGGGYTGGQSGGTRSGGGSYTRGR